MPQYVHSEISLASWTTKPPLVHVAQVRKCDVCPSANNQELCVTKRGNKNWPLIFNSLTGILLAFSSTFLRSLIYNRPERHTLWPNKKRNKLRATSYVNHEKGITKKFYFALPLILSLRKHILTIGNFHIHIADSFTDQLIYTVYIACIDKIMVDRYCIHLQKSTV